MNYTNYMMTSIALYSNQKGLPLREFGFPYLRQGKNYLISENYNHYRLRRMTSG